MNHKNIVTKYSPPRAERFFEKDSFWKVDNNDSQHFLKSKYGKSLTDTVDWVIQPDDFNVCSPIIILLGLISSI